MLLAIYKEMKDKLSLIDVAGNSALVVMSVLAFSVTFAKMTYVLKFVLFKLQQAPATKAKIFLLSDILLKKTICVTHRRGPSRKYIHNIS